MLPSGLSCHVNWEFCQPKSTFLEPPSLVSPPPSIPSTPQSPCSAWGIVLVINKGIQLGG